MPLDEADSELFKVWVIKKLEAISDADSEVLADYVLALVKTDDSVVVAKANCIENLRDFIGNSARSFVNDVFQALATKSYDPSRPQLKPTAPIYEPPRRTSSELPSLPNESRKRSYQDRDAEPGQNGQNQPFGAVDRSLKQSRRGGRGWESRGGGQISQPVRGGYGAPQPYAQQVPPLQLPSMPTPPPGMPPFDPNNPLAALFAMGQAMGFMPSAPGFGPPSATPGHIARQIGQRCRDYDQKGYCMRGGSCLYEHDDNAFVVPQQIDEYDPTNAVIFDVAPNPAEYPSTPRSSGRANGSVRGRVERGAYGGSRPQRAEFSMTGANHNQSIKSIVVEQIPEEHFDEQSVRAFFGEFGSVESVTMQPYKRLAVVQFASHDSAKAAYKSPKSVFENRFVKVYWYKSDSLPHPTEIHPSVEPDRDVNGRAVEPLFDLEEVAARQAEAQRKHDEAKRQREEAQKRRQELDEMLVAVNLERKKAADALAKRTWKGASLAGGNDDEDEQTKFLKAKLAELQNEAWSLGIDPDSDEPVPYAPAYVPRRRGGYRGRFASRGRGRHPSMYRGGYGGAGGGFNGDGHYQEETLRQYLMFNGLESAIMTRHPGCDDAALVAFQQRFEAENFMAAAVYDGPLAASDFPGQLGKTTLAWYKGEEDTPSARGNGVTEQDSAKLADAEATGALAEYQPASREERDMDTYDE
ncbi:hypothetical protein LTR91_022127 [Friedmanniomyces endolithicus]|uniref:C3H1-type domain-containing protein n=1 Tax=Friedmanniomyces endolithicus TaxID=329885 RepID=A0AAN6HBC6_9PEZI|nr:hypothetical protein LTR75_013945 [Friedmanniomyces endolithicus]KAK0901463.1 hypothetical protein LTR57_020121 [Friedmanniomyces endolithicus]KAK0904207.1 hypothetical protein LTR02_007135 [Friedmanniomyces endolithicus]KAK0956922.1 hypothetical protein LTR91_022127 [Friedmanniomyces endolithicus]